MHRTICLYCGCKPIKGYPADRAFVFGKHTICDKCKMLDWHLDDPPEKDQLIKTKLGWNLARHQERIKDKDNYEIVERLPSQRSGYPFGLVFKAEPSVTPMFILDWMRSFECEIETITAGYFYLPPKAHPILQLDHKWILHNRARYYFDGLLALDNQYGYHYFAKWSRPISITCFACLKVIDLTKYGRRPFHLSHWLASKHGGKVESGNIYPLCPSCNRLCGSKTIGEYLKTDKMVQARNENAGLA